MVPPFAQSNTKMYHGRVEAIASILSYLEAQKEKYVILSDCNIASDVDYADLMQKHISAGADVTMVYERAAIPEALQTGQLHLRFRRKRPHDAASLQRLPHRACKTFP